MSEKSRAIAGAMPKARVITGNATAPPPSLVIPRKREVIQRFTSYVISLSFKNDR